MGDGFYRSKDPTNGIKVLKEKATKEKPEKRKTTKYAHKYTTRKLCYRKDDRAMRAI